MSHKRVLNKIDEFGENFDELVKEWRANIEHNCKKQSVLSTIMEVVEEAEMEIVPDGMETVNIADIGLSFTASPHLAGCIEDLHQDRSNPVDQWITQDTDTSLSNLEIKERVKLRMGSKFSQQAFDFVIGEIRQTNNGILNSKTLRDFDKTLKMAHPAPYQITGDNLDLMIKVKHMSSTNQNNSIHWFNLNAVKNRVLANHLPNDQPIKSVLDIENVDFLPSAKDNDKYLHDITALVTRVVIKNVPAFANFKDVVIHHLPHKYSDDMKEKSIQVN